MNPNQLLLNWTDEGYSFLEDWNKQDHKMMKKCHHW